MYDMYFAVCNDTICKAANRTELAKMVLKDGMAQKACVNVRNREFGLGVEEGVKRGRPRIQKNVA